jgi:hypothetical protein
MLARRDVNPLDPPILRLLKDGRRSKLGAIVADNGERLAALGDQRGQLARHPDTRERGIRRQRQPFARKVVVDAQEAEPPAAGQAVRHEVEAPALVGPSGKAIGARVPNARLGPPRRRTLSSSSRKIRSS